MQTVRVRLESRSYDVLIGAGALGAAKERLALLTAKPSAIVADETVLRHHGDSLRAVLPDLPAETVPPGEASKSFAHYQRLCEALLARGVERGGALIAFGGGVTGDLTGFVAATLRRGCGLVQIPTTLLSMVDSSVGGKTAINVKAGKNLVGAFHQPSLVVIDTHFLRTLPKREFLAGYAEVVKTAALGDKDFFTWLEEHGDDVAAQDQDKLGRAIASCCSAKAAIVAEDEREAGQRALLNLGHTFGHAIEAIGGYDGRVLHGEAVGIGMAMAARFSAREGLMGETSAQRLEKLLTRAGLMTNLRALPFRAEPEALLAAMGQDKKVEGGSLTLILLKGLGQAFVRKGQDPAPLLAFLKDEWERSPT